MSELRVRKMQEFIKQEVGNMLLRELKDPRLGFVTVTGVKLTGDLREATVYVSLFGQEEERKESLMVLNKSKGFIRKELGTRLKVYYTPEISFEEDKSLDYGMHIEGLLKRSTRRMAMGIKIGQAKEIEMEEAVAFLHEHDHFLLAGHEHPDGDDVGSLCALYNVLVSMGKTADMILPDPVPSAFTLVKSSAKVLMEIPEDGTYDAMVFTDLANISRGGDFNFPDVPSLCIDHHQTNEKYTDYLYLKYKYAATAEMLAEMFFAMGLKLDRDTCNALYMGIGTDSGFFKFSCTSEHTLLMASHLVKMGADPSYISNKLDEKTEEAMKCYKLVADTVHSYKDGKIVVAYMNKEAMALDGENSDYYASIPRCIKGAEIAALFKYKEQDEYRVSLRSLNYANVADLAAEFGGGGHWKASGCTMNGTLSDCERVFVEKAEKYL